MQELGIIVSIIALVYTTVVLIQYWKILNPSQGSGSKVPEAKQKDMSMFLKKMLLGWVAMWLGGQMMGTPVEEVTTKDKIVKTEILKNTPSTNGEQPVTGGRPTVRPNRGNIS